MPQHFVQTSVQPRAMRNQDNGSSTLPQALVNVSQGPDIVGDVLDEVEAHDSVKILPLGKSFTVHGIRVAHVHVRAGGAKRLEIIQVVRVNVRRPICRAGHEMYGHVSDSGTNFEDALSHVWADHIGHPSSKAWSAVESFQDFTALSIVRVYPARRTVAKNCPESSYTILPTDFLALAIGPARIADGHLENSSAWLGELDRKLRFHVKSRTLEGNAFQQVGAGHLVAGFHIRQVEVADGVAQECKKLIPERMPEKQSALIASRHKARTKNCIRIFRQKQFDHL